MKRTLIILITVLATTSAYPFEVDGIRSGMTMTELSSIASFRHLETWEIGHGIWAMGIRSQYRVDATFSFCEQTGLVNYARSIDPDSDYLSTVERALNAHGQPNVSVRRLPWSGPGGGDVQEVVMQWTQGPNETEVTFAPEGRDGTGKLRYQRGAGISYLDRSRICKTK